MDCDHVQPDCKSLHQYGKAEGSFVVYRQSNGRRIHQYQGTSPSEVNHSKGQQPFYLRNERFGVKKKNNDPLLFTEYRGLGDYYERTGDYKKALDYYLKTVENLKSLDLEDPAFTEVNKSISEIYARMGEKEKESAYLKKYTEKTDQRQAAVKEGTDEAV